MKYSVDPKKFNSDPGSPIHVLYSAKIDKNGVTVLEKVGEENTDDMIQAAAASTDINQIVSYYMNTGDDTVLNRYVPQYGDFTKIPKTLAEFLQLRIDSQNFFDALPAEIKSQFDNNADMFFAQAGNEDWYVKLKPVVDPDYPGKYTPDIELEKEVIADAT